MRTAIVQKYIGIPYIHLGRNPDIGLDCWGLIKCIYKDAGYDIIDLENYDQNWAKKGKNYFVENYHCQFEEVSCPEIMDIVLLLNSKGVANHAGVYLNTGIFIHCCKQGVVKSSIREKRWRGRVEGFYRLIQKN